MKLYRQNPPDKSTAFRLPSGLLTTVDLICEKQDITRSQLYRRSIAEFVKSQQIEPEPAKEWASSLYKFAGRV